MKLLNHTQAPHYYDKDVQIVINAELLFFRNAVLLNVPCHAMCKIETLLSIST